jgi:hypothetical protein
MARLEDTDITTVNELINKDYQWNIPRIRSLFFAPDVDAVLSIPLKHNGGEDVLA